MFTGDGVQPHVPAARPRRMSRRRAVVGPPRRRVPPPPRPTPRGGRDRVRRHRLGVRSRRPRGVADQGGRGRPRLARDRRRSGRRARHRPPRARRASRWSGRRVPSAGASMPDPGSSPRPPPAAGRCCARVHAAGWSPSTRLTGGVQWSLDTEAYFDAGPVDISPRGAIAIDPTAHPPMSPAPRTRGRRGRGGRRGARPLVLLVLGPRLRRGGSVRAGPGRRGPRLGGRRGRRRGVRRRLGEQPRDRADRRGAPAVSARPSRRPTPSTPRTSRSSPAASRSSPTAPGT